MFKSVNVTKFLKRYKDLYFNYYILAKDKLAKLPITARTKCKSNLLCRLR
jgi:hypothetical protein